jgi:hypothetical protein
VTWFVEFPREFDPEYDELEPVVRDELLVQVKLLEQFGPHRGRPRVDTLNGSKYPNMKELRLEAGDGVWNLHLRSIRVATR